MSTKKKDHQGQSVKEQTGYYDVPERYEIIDGIRYDFLASPKIVHQILLSELYTYINLNFESA